MDKQEMIIVQKYPRDISGKSQMDDNKELDCFICDVKNENWKEHKTSILHTLNLQYFFQSFHQLSEDDIKCKLCRNPIPKCSLKKHAMEEHKLIPWHKKDFKSIACFINFVKPVDKTKKCLLCNEKFKNSAFIQHIKDPKHQHLLKDYIKETISIAKLETSFCKKSIANCIYPYETTQLQCLVCNIIIEGYNAANKHIADETHKENLSIKDVNTISLDDLSSCLLENLKVCDSKNCSSSDSAENSRSASRASTSSGYESTFNINDNNSDNDDNKSSRSTVKHEILDMNKMISECDLENQFIKCFEHFIFVTDNYYFCNLCEKSISSSALMLLHIKDLSHLNLVEEQRQKYHIDKHKLFYTPKFYELLVRNNVFQLTPPILKCLLCNCNVSHCIYGEKHVNEKKHKLALVRKTLSISYDTKSVNQKYKSNEKNILSETKKDFAQYFSHCIEKQSNYYYCHLCCIDLFPSEVKKHMKIPEHIERVKCNCQNDQFKDSLYYSELCVRNSIFSSTDPGLKCYTCRKLIDSTKKDLAEHVRSEEHENNQSHRLLGNEKSSEGNTALPQEVIPIVEEQIDGNIQLMPVIALEENFIKFFENFIFISDTFYRCTLCKTNSSSSFSMLLHINDSNHQNRLKERREELGINDHKVSYTPNFYELLVRNNIFQFDSLKLRCTSCECILKEPITVESHLNSKCHENNLQCTFAVMNALIPIGSINKNSLDAQRTLPETKNNFSKYFGNFIEICPENYFCHLCCTILPSWTQVMTHIEIQSHFNVVRNRYVDTMIQNSLFYSELCVRNSIFCLRAAKFKCYICDKIILSKEEIEKHVESGHKQKFRSNRSFAEEIANLHPHEVDLIEKSSRSTTEKKISKLKLIPKISLEDQFITCFKNFICIYKNFYSCSLCQENFPTSILMLEHTNKSKHINLLNKRRQMCGIKESTTSYTPNFYELLIRNNIFQHTSLAFKCFSCKCILKKTYYCIEEHINGSKHGTTHKKIIVDKIQKFDKTKASSLFISGDINTDAEIILPESKENFAEYFGNFIEKRSKDYYCHLCCITLSPSGVKFHMKTQKHLDYVTRRYKYKKPEDFLFYSELCVRNGIFSNAFSGLKCFTCKMYIGWMKDIVEHVESEKHKTNYNAKSNVCSLFTQPVIPPQPTVDVKSNSSFSSCELPQIYDQFLELFKNFIFLRQENDYFCNYCRISITKSDTMTHLNSLLHRDKIKSEKKMILKACNIVTDYNFEKLVRNNIFPYNSTKVMCYSCDNIIHSYKNVNQHIKDRKHEYIISKFRTTSVSKDSSIKTQSSNVKNSKKSTNDFSKVLSCDIYKYDDTKRDFLSCNVCRKKINSRNVLHVHLTGHFWEPGNILVSKNQIIGQASLNYFTERRDVCIEKKSDVDNQNSDEVFRSKVPEKNKKSKDDQQRKQRGRKIILDDLDVDENKVSSVDIYKIDEEVHNMIQLSLSRVCKINSKIFCMICRKDIEYSLQTVYQHFRSLEHSYFMMQMIQDHAQFEDFSEELSDFELAREMIEDKSDEHAVCFVCNPVKPKHIVNKTESIKIHINSEKHQSKKAELSENLQKFINNLNSGLERSWFHVQRFWCVICNDKFKLEHKFCKHLKSVEHNKRYQKYVRFENLIYDFCPTCGVLYYGFKNTFTYHSNCEYHKFYLNKNLYLKSQLPENVDELVKNAEENLINQLKDLENNEPIMKKEKKLLLKDLKAAINDYGNAKIYPFGFRMTGLGSMNSGLDIFLGCYDSYYKGSELEDAYQKLTDVESLLKKNEKTWTIKRTIIDCRSPIIKLIHNTTNIDCDISFTNGLTTENTKLVKLYVDKFSMCKKLILFMRDWINVCNLNGEDGISDYAIAWMVIYYFQTKFIVPSVAVLIKNEGKSCMIGGWETGVPKELTSSDISINYSFKDLLKGFFIMCVGFDYRNNIMCPLLGYPIKKIDLTVLSRLENLPDELVLYKNYMRKNHNKLEAFCSDSIMCIQDPFDLSYNLTKATKKYIKHRFIIYCAMSSELNN